MLTGKLVRVRYARNRIIPCYIDSTDADWLEVARRMIELFQAQEGRARGALEEDLEELFGSDPAQVVHQGLAKLLEDRCDFEVLSGHPPEQLRARVFAAAAAARLNPPGDLFRRGFDRASILEDVGRELEMTPEAVEQGLFADLRSEQRLVRFKETTPGRLLERYNVALAQAVVLRSTRVEVILRGESPQRFRQLFRLVKFHRLVCEAERTGEDGYLLRLDGPLSLFSATQKYGLQLALFLPAVLLCRDFELKAELAWGPARKPKTFSLTPADRLVSHAADSGSYVPPELAMFADLFRKKIQDWEVSADVDVVPLGDGYWVPDYCLTERTTGRRVYLDILGFWRRSHVERHLQRLREHIQEPFVLALSDQLRVDEAELATLPAGVHRFRQMPLPDEVARLAREALARASFAGAP